MSFSVNLDGRLQQHLINRQHPSYSTYLELGTIDELSATSQILDVNPELLPLKSYPALPKRGCLVACIESWEKVKVFAVYSFPQIKQILTHYAVHPITWKILEISEEKEKDLLLNVVLSQGIIIKKRTSE
jgi:hypothetical protein